MLDNLLVFLWSELYLPWMPVFATIWMALTYIVPIVAVAVLFQALLPGTRRRPKVLSYEYLVDLMHVLLNGLFYLTFFGVAAGQVRAWMIERSPTMFADPMALPIWAQVLFAVWMFDFLVYWRHRLSHQIAVLWPIHAVHHTSHQVDVLTTHRLHFLEVLAGGVIVGWATAVSGLSQAALSMGLAIYLNYNHFIHSNVAVKFPGPLKYLLVSPFMHRWHHAREHGVRDKNFGVVFAWNDWIFRTAHHPDREPLDYGIDYPPGEAVGESYIGHQIYPFRIWGRRLVVRGMRWSRRIFGDPGSTPRSRDAA